MGPRTRTQKNDENTTCIVCDELRPDKSWERNRRSVTMNARHVVVSRYDKRGKNCIPANSALKCGL
jgi:DNA-binding transcriptional regulator YdaS (Cro superfamily)